MLELANRQADLSLREIFVHFRDLVSADMDWADSRKVRFRQRASWVKIGSLTLAGLSTVVLGIKAIPAQTEFALPMVALVTVLGALETFFNWRSRWVLMEETQYRLNRLRDEMDYYLMVTPSDSVERQKLDSFFDEQQRIWADASRRWIEFRALNASQPTDRTTFSG
ncbi:SLATT domain-containing protein [Micromonospora sp. NPDC005113]